MSRPCALAAAVVAVSLLAGCGWLGPREQPTLGPVNFIRVGGSAADTAGAAEAPPPPASAEMLPDTAWETTPGAPHPEDPDDPLEIPPGVAPASPAAPAGDPAPAATPPAPPADPPAPDRASAHDRPPSPAAGASDPAPPGARSYTPVAMIGQVNGQPIYSDAALAPLERDLAELGNRVPRDVFRRQAAPLVSRRVRAMVSEALLLGEAERDLNDTEREALRRLMNQHREELIRRWGSGSEFIADQRLQERTERGLEETLAEGRRTMIIQRYLKQQLLPRIDVSRRDVERYYQEHASQYNPPRQRTLRVIRARGADAEGLAARLEAGDGFASVAADPANRFRSGQGGLWRDVSGDVVFEAEPLNEAMLALREGEHSPPVRIGDETWWVHVESIRQPPGRPLREVQAEIQDTLRQLRLEQVTRQYEERLFAQGSYNPLRQMEEALLEVAVSRFALPE